ncbi:MAG: S49 family peptidase [Halobacteriales archaeon]
MAQSGEESVANERTGWAGRVSAFLSRASRSYVLVIVLGLIIGLQIAPVVSDTVTDPISGKVAVIPVQGSVGNAAPGVINDLQKARRNPEIKAVVLQVNSPGGAASASESLYIEVKKTAKQMPVVAVVTGIAASGGYYAAVPADQIYVKPASLVGSVGVIFTGPGAIPPLDQIITTGPNKLSGGTQRDWIYRTEALRRAFVSAVVKSRGDQLKISREEISYANIYTGAGAVKKGLADKIGNGDDAIKRAANLAGLDQYSVTRMSFDGTARFVTRTGYLNANVESKKMVKPTYFIGGPQNDAVPTFLMVPPRIAQEAYMQAYGPQQTNNPTQEEVNTTDVAK